MRISDWSSDVCSSDLIITREKWAKQGKQMGETDEKMLAMIRTNIVDQFDRESHAFAATARLFDDGLIDPRDTRKVQIGRASCRERVGQYGKISVVAVSLNKKRDKYHAIIIHNL